MDKFPTRGEIYKHTKTGNCYQIIGSSWNTVEDRLEIAYAPLYVCDFSQFTRPLINHPKAWMTPNTDGSPRYVRVQA